MRKFALGLVLGLGLASAPAFGLGENDKREWLRNWPVIDQQGKIVCDGLLLNRTRKQGFCLRHLD